MQVEEKALAESKNKNPSDIINIGSPAKYYKS